MTWDTPLTAAVAEELDGLLKGARLRGHRFDWSRRELALFFRTSTLRWHLHPEAGWVTLSAPVEPPEEARPLSADLLWVSAPRDERVLRFSFRKVRGRTSSIQVIVELMTGQWNALLVEDQEEWIRHVLWSRQSGGRDLSVGQAYAPPAPSVRRGSEEPLTEAEWRKLVRDPQDPELPAALLKGIAFTSPLNLPALLGEGGEAREEEGTGMEVVAQEERDDSAGETVAESLGGYPLWLQLRARESVQPCLLESTRGKQPYIMCLKGFTCTHFPTILAAVEAASREEPGQPELDHGLLDRLERTLQQAQGRVRGIEREMEEASDPETSREIANLLLARLGEIRRGVSEVTLKGFSGEPVVLQLDPTLSPHENAEALYEEAARRERALHKLPPLLASARKQVEELVLLQEQLLAGAVSADEARGRFPSGPQRDRETRQGPGIRLPYKRYRSSGGLEIRVGRGSSDNDALTFQHARPDDVWLHAREASGAHVVLRWVDQDAPPGKDLAEAAILAALHSRARHAGVVPVDWTRRKHVRKPRRTPPGTVLLDRASTLFVEPDPALPDRLAWED